MKAKTTLQEEMRVQSSGLCKGRCGHNHTDAHINADADAIKQKATELPTEVRALCTGPGTPTEGIMLAQHGANGTERGHRSFATCEHTGIGQTEPMIYWDLGIGFIVGASTPLVQCGGLMGPHTVANRAEKGRVEYVHSHDWSFN